MPKNSICRDCVKVKPLDKAIGRCMNRDTAFLFCKLDDKTHSCRHHRVNKEST